MRLKCFCCSKIVSTEVPDGTIIRGIIQCPECCIEEEIKKEEKKDE